MGTFVVAHYWQLFAAAVVCYVCAILWFFLVVAPAFARRSRQMFSNFANRDSSDIISGINSVGSTFKLQVVTILFGLGGSACLLLFVIGLILANWGHG